MASTSTPFTEPLSPRQCASFFEPELATPSKNAKSKGRELSLPYTFMYVSGLKLGLTTADLRTMPYPRLVNMISAWNEANSSTDESQPKETVVNATQAHIDAILG